MKSLKPATAPGPNVTPPRAPRRTIAPDVATLTISIPAGGRLSAETRAALIRLAEVALAQLKATIPADEPAEDVPGGGRHVLD